MTRNKTFAAITTGDYVLFTFQAADTVAARELVSILRTRSDTITGIRLLRKDDLPYGRDFKNRSPFGVFRS